MPEWLSDNQRGMPGYEGYPSSRVASLAVVLEANGYSTSNVRGATYFKYISTSDLPAARSRFLSKVANGKLSRSASSK